MNLKTVIIDDDLLTVELLKQYVEEAEGLTLAASFTDPVEAFGFLGREEADLIIVDMEMPRLRGLDLIGSLPRRPRVIIVSSHRDYAAAGFDLNVADYIVKPVTLPRFLQAVAKLKPEPEPEPAVAEPDVLYFKVDKKVVRLPVADIYYFESCKDYLKVHHRGGSLITYQSLTGIEEFLSKKIFIRIHKSYIINMLNVAYIEPVSVKIGDDTLPVGKNYRDELVGFIRESRQYASKSKFI